MGVLGSHYLSRVLSPLWSYPHLSVSLLSLFSFSSYRFLGLSLLSFAVHGALVCCKSVRGRFRGSGPFAPGHEQMIRSRFVEDEQPDLAEARRPARRRRVRAAAEVATQWRRPHLQRHPRLQGHLRPQRQPRQRTRALLRPRSTGLTGTRTAAGFSNCTPKAVSTQWMCVVWPTTLGHLRRLPAWLTWLGLRTRGGATGRVDTVRGRSRLPQGCNSSRRTGCTWRQSQCWSSPQAKGHSCHTHLRCRT